jgi:hypothetical protein
VHVLAPVASVAFVALTTAACGTDGTATLVVRGADDVQVLTPQQVAEQRRPVPPTTVPPSTVAGATSDPDDATDTESDDDTADDAPDAPDATAAGETVPQNVDDRPPEVKLFEAFGKFRGCLEADGYGIEGDLLDPNNPAYQDPDYVDAVSTCAARTDIVAILQEVQATRSSLTPEEVAARNEVFIGLRDCLRGRGWTVETSTSEIGLLEPTVFVNAEGVLDERDINQCLSEQNLGD